MPPRYEYRVVPAPRRAARVKALRTAEDRFAHALGAVMNALGAEGWEYIRTDSLPVEERAGLASRRTVYRSMLVFRRPLAEDAPAAESPTRAAPPVTAARPARQRPGATALERLQASLSVPDPGPPPGRREEPALVRVVPKRGADAGHN